jgi:hypothetical protein
MDSTTGAPELRGLRLGADGRLSDEAVARFRALVPAVAGERFTSLVREAAALPASARLRGIDTLEALVADYPGRIEFERDALFAIWLPLDHDDPIRQLIARAVGGFETAAMAPTTREGAPAEADGGGVLLPPAAAPPPPARALPSPPAPSRALPRLRLPRLGLPRITFHVPRRASHAEPRPGHQAGRARALPPEPRGPAALEPEPALAGAEPEPALAGAEPVDVAPPPVEPAQPASHVAYGLLRAPAEAVVAEPFLLEVGLTPEQAPGVAGGPLNLPPLAFEPYTVNVRVVAVGFDFVDSPQRLSLEVSIAHPYPVRTIHLVANRIRRKRVDRKIVAEYSIDGERLGDAIRLVPVLREPALRTRPAGERTEAGLDVIAPSGEAKADLTLTVRNAEAGWITWAVDAPRELGVEASDSIRVEIGDPAAFLKDSIDQIDDAEGQRGVDLTVKALAVAIAGKIPDEVWDAIHKVAAAVHGPPSILLVSDEAYVPWELALVRDALIPGDPLPFLGAQARIGRWMQPQPAGEGRVRPSPNPARRKDVGAIGVVWGSYARTSWTNLEQAQSEGRALLKTYAPGVHVQPTMPSLRALLDGNPPADLLHFAVHGRYNPDKPMQENGIITTDGRSLNPNVISTFTLAANPVVFLNACQVAAGFRALGAYSGVAAEFVKAGASAVVAPLWKVDDAIAKELALAFYAAAAKGEPLSEILRRARANFKLGDDTTSATWMAYQLFGHPAFVVGGLESK